MDQTDNPQSEAESPNEVVSQTNPTTDNDSPPEVLSGPADKAEIEKRCATRETIMGSTEQLLIDVIEDHFDMGDVWILEMDALIRDEYEDSMISGSGRKTRMNLKMRRANLLVRSIVDGPTTRRLIFKPHDAVALARKPLHVIGPLYAIAAKLSDVDDDADENAEGN